MPTPDPSPSVFIESLQQVAALIDAGRPREALTLARDLFARGSVPRPLLGDLCNLAGVAAQSLGLEPVAEQMWRHSIASEPRLIAAHAQLGQLLARQHRDAEAEACCRQALEREPGHLGTLLTLGAVLARQRREAEAEACYRKAVQSAPRSVAARTDLGALLMAQKRHPEAERCFREALVLAPDNAHAHGNLGLLMAALGRPAEAERSQRRALASAGASNPPTRAAILSNLGNLLAQSGRDDEAEACQREAVALDPDAAAMHCNLGVLLRDRDLRDEAEACLRRALALRPGHLLAQLHLSALLLADGRFEEGWRLHEARHHPDLPDNGIPGPSLGVPRWQGESLAGKSVLVWPEQGLGDQIQFARYAALLKSARGAARVTLVCQKALAALFGTLGGIDTVHAAEIADNRFQVPGVDLSRHDHWVFPLSLPQAFGTTLDSVPAPIPYLQAPAERLAAWSARIDRQPGRRRVGLVWRGNPKHDNDAERSLPGLETLAPLWSTAAVDFFSLQTGSAGDAAARTLLPGQPLQHLGIDLRDFADTAAALAQLDLLICVDTSIAHLAGALGVPAFVLLPRHKTDWRWLEGRADSPWYPRTMRLFRQQRRGDWAPVVEAVRAALAGEARAG